MDVIVKGSPSIEIGFERKVVDSYKEVDSALSESSVNPVQNKVVTAELNKKATKTEVSALEAKVTENKTATDTALSDLSTKVDEEVEGLQTQLDSNGVLIEDLQNTKIDKEADDYYPQLSVGVADNLAGHEDATPSEIGFRRSGGGAILDGNARIETIKGNSVVWNQLISLWKGSQSVAGVTIMGDTEVVANGTAERDSAISLSSPNPYMIQGHKYFMRGCPSSGSSSTYYLTNQAGANDYGNGVIFTANYESGGRAIIIRFNAGVTFDNVVFRPQLFDLTKMFGAGNEPTTIEEFYARKPIVEDEFAYNEGEVIHNATDKIESVGVNQWDEEWHKGSYDNQGNSTSTEPFVASKNPVKVLPNKEYLFSHKQDKAVFVVYWYDNNMKFISRVFLNNNITTISPNGACYMNFRMQEDYGYTYNHDICINLSDPLVNGKYFPYVKREQSLDIIGKYFPQGMKSAVTAHDEIRYNKTTQKWEKVQRIGEVDMGTMNWFYIESEGMLYAPDGRFYAGQSLICSRYINRPGYDNDSNMYAVKDNLRIFDSAYTDAATFKAAMAGVMLYYELAEPIVTEIDENINLDYLVWNAGTEKAVADTPSTPLKADIIYGFNAYGVIKELLARVASLEAANASLVSQLASVTSHNEEV